MSENDAMEGKKIELHIFEQKVMEALEIAEKQEQDKSVISNSIMSFEIEIQKVDNKLEIHAFGEKILTLEKGEFNYNIEGLKNIQEKLEKNSDYNYKQFGLPDIEYLEELEKQKEEERGEPQKDEKDLSEDMEKEQEKKKEEKEKKDKEKEEPETSDDKNKIRTLTKLNDKVIKFLVPSARDYNGIYLDSAGKIVGENKKSGKIEDVKGITEIKGNSINKNIHGTENREHKHVNAEIMYRINSKQNTGFAVIRDGTEKGNRDLRYTISRVNSNNIEDFAYVDIPLLYSQEKVGLARVREISGERQGVRRQGNIDKVLDEVDELNEKREIPDDIMESFDEEMKRQPNGIISMKQLKQILVKIITTKLDAKRK